MLHNVHNGGSWISNGDNMFEHGGGMMGGYGFHGFYSLLMMVLIAVAIIFAIRWMWRAGHPDQPSASSALQILAERYAKGEIDEAEYLDRKKNLT